MLEGAFRFHCRHDWRGSLQNLEQAIAINPSLAHAHILLGLVLGTLRDPAALAAIDTARQLDPLAPPVSLARALCLSSWQRYEESESEVHRMLELNASFHPALELAADLFWLRADPRALEWERRVWAADAEMSALLARPDPGAALSDAATCLHRRAENRYVSPRVTARLLSLSGRIDESTSVLEDAIAEGDLMQIDFVQMAPSFETVRRTSRFAQLAAGIGLPDAD